MYFWRCGPRTAGRVFSRYFFTSMIYYSARLLCPHAHNFIRCVMVYLFGGQEMWDIIVHLARKRERERKGEGNKEQGYRLCESRATFSVLRRNWFTWTGSQLRSCYYTNEDRSVAFHARWCAILLPRNIFNRTFNEPDSFLRIVSICFPRLL